MDSTPTPIRRTTRAGRQDAAWLRKTAFRGVLYLAGETQKSWADRYGCTDSHLSLVLAGQRESAPLERAIEAYLDEARSCFQRHCPITVGAAR